MLTKIEQSEDGTTKFIFEKGFHCVLIPSKNNKKTLCVSSQHGCGMGCTFCLTAKMGFLNQLSCEEIVEQFETALQHCSESEVASKNNYKIKEYAKDFITSIVFMGMGEPLANYKEVSKAIKYIHEQYFYSLRKITLSTCGILPSMEKLLIELPQIQLALSFHSPFQKIRDTLMPQVKQWSVKKLVEYCNKYMKITKTPVMIEYLMINGLTDRDVDLKEIKSLEFKEKMYFNLIPLNGSVDFNGEKYTASSLKQCINFKEELMNMGFKCFIRTTMGDDIKAACGMLNGPQKR